MHWQNLYFKDIIFLEYCYQIIYLTVGHADKDIFTQIYGGKEGFNDRNLTDSLRRQSLKKCLPKKGGKMGTCQKSTQLRDLGQKLN